MNANRTPSGSQGDRDARLARKGRHVAIVIAATMVLWLLGGLWIGPAYLPGRFAFLFDFAALAALIYALINIYQLWRLRQKA